MYVSLPQPHTPWTLDPLAKEGGGRVRNGLEQREREKEKEELRSAAVKRTKRIAFPILKGGKLA